MPDIKQMLAQAKQLLKTDKKKAREILLQVVDIDERNEEAWLYMSGVVDSIEEQIVALENVLALNPNHKTAQKGLDTIRQRTGKSAPTPPPPAPQSDNAWGNIDSFENTDSFGSSGFGDSLGSSTGGFGEPFGGANSSDANPFGDSTSSWGEFGSAESSHAAPVENNPFGEAPDPWGGLEDIADPWGNPPAVPAAPQAETFDPWKSATPVIDDPWGSGTSAPAYNAEDDDPYSPTGNAASTFAFGDDPQPAKVDAPQAPIFTMDDGFTFDEDGVSDGFAFGFESSSSEIDDIFGESVASTDHDDDPFAEEKPRKAKPPKKVAAVSPYYNEIPEELRSSGTAVGRNMLIAVGVLGLLNVAALLGIFWAL